MPAGECSFCAIGAGEQPGHVVLSDEVAVAFLDTRPVFKGHVLVAPRAHVETLPDLPSPAVGPQGRPARLLLAPHHLRRPRRGRVLRPPHPQGPRVEPLSRWAHGMAVRSPARS
ncbi:HIT family protein [Streptosporangium roseum]|uniref:HIT family protein n=1 Tax=Streptosporangium roseum TaxID=2001 RepID=UPI001E3D6960|nr:HIT domain-containing protein [Streptosporangium roseum]